MAFEAVAAASAAADGVQVVGWPVEPPTMPSAVRVARSAMPVTGSRCEPWYSLTRASVIGPNQPVMGRPPRARWSALTASDSIPYRRSPADPEPEPEPFDQPGRVIPSWVSMTFSATPVTESAWACWYSRTLPWVIGPNHPVMGRPPRARCSALT